MLWQHSCCGCFLSHSAMLLVLGLWLHLRKNAKAMMLFSYQDCIWKRMQSQGFCGGTRRSCYSDTSWRSWQEQKIKFYLEISWIYFRMYLIGWRLILERWSLEGMVFVGLKPSISSGSVGLEGCRRVLSCKKQRRRHLVKLGGGCWDFQ